MNKLFILLAALLLACTTFAQRWHCGSPNAQDVTATLDGATFTISGAGAMVNYDGSSAPWSDSVAAIEKVVISEGVTNIGNWSFFSCHNLTSVAIPGSVTSIGDMAFYDCIALASFEVSANNTVYDSKDGVLVDKTKTTRKARWKASLNYVRTCFVMLCKRIAGL
ncbi:hypothetical protein AGMMS4956_19110 [Bacteroidia bacterium]|nr:hypothetical protein AGMMS4956_19110 [Bacteroidia bacterium]